MTNSLAARLVRRPSALSLAALGASLFVVSSARASGFESAQFGSDQGQPALGNAYSVYFNPGAMVAATGTQVTLDGVLAVHSETYTRAASALTPSQPGSPQASYPTYVQSNTGEATLLNVLTAPFLGMVTDFGGSRWRLGIAGYAPFGGSVQWDKSVGYAGSSAPGAYDGPQRWQSIATTTSTLAGTAALGYRVAPRVGVGINVSVMRTAIVDVRARNADGSDDVFAANGHIAEGRSLIDVSGVQVGASAGAWWEVTRDRNLRLGLSYTSPPNFGTMRLKGTFQQQLAGVSGTTPASDADLLQAYPDIIRLGGAWRLRPEAELRADVAMELWSRFKSQCVVLPNASCDVGSNGSDATGGKILANIPRNWQNSYKLRLGGAYWIVPQTEVFGSVALESSPAPSAYEDPLVFDSTRIYGTLGVRHEIARRFAFQLAYTYVYFLPVTVNDSASGSYVPPSRVPSSNGSYSGELFVFNAAASYRF